MNSGQLRAQVQTTLDSKYATIERAFQGDAAAARSLAEDPMLPVQMKNELQGALERPRSAEATTARLATIRVRMTELANSISQNLERGTQTAFSNAITGMLYSSLIIVLIGTILVLFIPELPLRTEPAAKMRAEGELEAESVRSLEH